MLIISHSISIPNNEIQMTAIRAQGSGGQNVNKVSSAIHLRFDIQASSLNDFYKQNLLAMHDHRITQNGIIIIKAQEYKSQDMNRQMALQRLSDLIRQAGVVKKARINRKPSRASKQKRMDKKTKHGKTKSLRGKIDY